MNGVLTKNFITEPSAEWLDVPTRVVFNELMNKRNYIKHCLEDDEIPKSQPGWECQYCAWSAFCFNNDDYDDYTMPHEMETILEGLPDL